MLCTLHETNLPLVTDLLLNFIDLCVDLGSLILSYQTVSNLAHSTDPRSTLTLTVVLVQGDNLVYSHHWGIPASLRLFDLLRISTFVDNEVEDVEHFDEATRKRTV